MYNPENPNDSVDLTMFDYNNLVGDDFKRYLELIKSLNGFNQMDFVQYYASGIFKTEFDEKLNKVERLIGIKINNPKPINKTRTQVKFVTDLNMQIYVKDNPASNSRFFLLKK